jgi:hypothetical protein
MTVEEALVILNQNDHRGYSDWRCWHWGGEPREIYADSQPNNDSFGSLLPIEAIAIAEHYERKPKPIGTLKDAVESLGAIR